MHSPAALKGVVPPVVTPLTIDEQVDHASLRRLIKWLLQRGVHGLWVMGSTGEFAALDAQQRAEAIATVVDTVAGRVPVLAGISDAGTELAVRHGRAAREAGADAVAATPPYYFPVAQDEILAHYRRIREAVDLPLLIYNFPKMVKVNLDLSTALELAGEGTVIGIKDSQNDLEWFRRLMVGAGRPRAGLSRLPGDARAHRCGDHGRSRWSHSKRLEHRARPERALLRGRGRRGPGGGEALPGAGVRARRPLPARGRRFSRCRKHFHPEVDPARVGNHRQCGGGSPAAAPGARGTGAAEIAPEGAAKRNGGHDVMASQGASAALVDVAWVQARLTDPKLLLIDTRISDEYARGHLPGAISWDTYLKYHWADTSPEGMAEFNRLMEFTVGRVGITREHRVVFYDEGAVGYRAIRGFWLLDYLGHDDVHMLEGGLAAWQEAGGKRSTEPRRLEPTPFSASVRPELVATYRDLLAGIGRPAVTILDTRAPDEYSGENLRAIRGGRVPGAINVDYVNNVDERGRYKSPAELRRMYQEAGVRPEQEILTYCHGGFRAAHSWLALRLAGYPRVRPYLGSWQEWGDRTDLPIEVPEKA